MARCRDTVKIDKVAFTVVDKLFEVEFNMLTDIENCARINTSNYVSIVGTTVDYDQYDRPEDAFNCLPNGCRNSGTLNISGSGDDDLQGVFNLYYDSTQFAAGVITYYVKVDEPGTYTVTTAIKDIREATASDIYTNTITAENEGFYPVVVDLSLPPSSTTGAGWTPTTSGVTVTTTVTKSGGTAEDTITIGLSSYYFYNSLADFAVNEVVKLGCVEDFSGDLTIDALDATCFRSGYDATSTGWEKTITFKKWTPNYWLLNPLAMRGDATEGWLSKTDERLVECQEINGMDYGYIQVPDLQTNECGFLTIAISDQCNVSDSTLDRLNAPGLVVLGDRQYIVLDGSITTELDAGTILFNESMIGKTVVINYPQRQNVERFVFKDDALYQRRTRMSYKRCLTDGKEEQVVFNNVLITSYPDSLTTDENSMDLTITIQRDLNDEWGYTDRSKDS